MPWFLLQSRMVTEFGVVHLKDFDRTQWLICTGTKSVIKLAVKFCSEKLFYHGFFFCSLTFLFIHSALVSEFCVIWTMVFVQLIMDLFNEVQTAVWILGDLEPVFLHLWQILMASSHKEVQDILLE